MREATKQVLRQKLLEYSDKAEDRSATLLRSYRETWQQVEELRALISGIFDIYADLGGDESEIRDRISNILGEENLIELVFPKQEVDGT